ncbi:polyprenyl diphosphate synthase [Halovenus sp. HT40]|uniref:polyprenyl diphosphate synthase n=1 Tax=Halovenus sp. HT40 TaxID=3126691 RepID=UPI00300E8DEC
MFRRLRAPVEQLYARVLESELEATPSHIAVIQDGNRRYAAKQGVEKTAGHRKGAETTEALLKWCADLDIEEVTLYTFSTENFERPADEREALFDLVTEKLRDFADADDVHEREVRIRAIGQTEELPERVRDAVDYAESRTEGYDRLHLNIALAYGGRAELLGATRSIASAVEAGELDPDEVTTETIDEALPDGPTRSVDLIIRPGGDERTSNFLPWQANGNEAAVYFTTPYWPEFRRIDFLRALRTYNYREESWHQSRIRRARALAKVLSEMAGQSGKRVTSSGEEDMQDGDSAEQTVESPS